MYEGLSPELGPALALLRAAFRQLQSASAILIGSEPVVVAASERLQLLLGRDPTGIPLLDAIPEIATPDRLDTIRQAYAIGEPALLTAVPLPRVAERDSAASPSVDIRFTPLRDESGGVAGLVLELIEPTDPLRAERELRNGLARLDAILGAVQDGITVQDPTGRLAYANDAAARLVGLRDGRTFLATPLASVLAEFELLDAQGRPLDYDALPGRRALHGEPDAERLVGYRHRKTNEVRWSMDRARAVRDSTGQLLMVVTAFQDLTELILREHRLVESEARFRAVADTAPVLIWQTDADGRREYVNLPWLAFTGRGLEDELGDGWTAGVHPEDVAATAASYQDAFAARRPFRLEYRLRRQDDEYRWMLEHGIPRFAPDGSFLGYIASCIDVHDYVEQQEALEETTHRLEATAAELEQAVEELQRQKSEAQRATERAESARRRSAFLAEAGRTLASSVVPDVRLRSLVHLIVSALADWGTVHLVDDDGRVRRLEIAHSDPESLELLRRLEERYAQRLDESSTIVRVARSGRAELYEEVTDEQLRSAAGDERYLDLLRQLDIRSAMLVPLRAHDRTLGVLTLLATGESGRRYDVEDLELAEEVARRAALAIHNARLYDEARSAERVKATFLAVMSHELRTPLTAITGNADLLELQLWGSMNAKQLERVGRIKTNSLHLTTIIDEILGFARLEAAREEPHVEEFDVPALVREVVRLAEADAVAKGIVLVSKAAGPPRRWTSDPTKLRLILFNIVGNAVKFTEEGLVEVGVEQSDGHLVVRVKDSGPGITPDQIERIFEPFTQVDASPTRVKGGLGLGLPVSRRLARLLGGDVTVISAPGEGSTFTVTVPRGDRFD